MNGMSLIVCNPFEMTDVRENDMKLFLDNCPFKTIVNLHFEQYFQAILLEFVQFRNDLRIFGNNLDSGRCENHLKEER